MRRAPTPPEAPLPPAAPLVVPPLGERHAPSLTLDLHIAPNPLAVGSTATFTLTITNQSADAAEGLLLTMPVPAEATALTAAPQGAWSWTPGRLRGRASLSFSGQLQLRAAPPGDALLLRPQAHARGLDLPVTIVGGVPTVAPQPASRATTGGAAATFTPGRASQLQSDDGTVQVETPADLYPRGLRLTHRTLAQAQATLQARPARVRNALARPPRGFAPFLLDASDSQGAPVHRFDHQLSIAVRYTPQQLQAVGIAERDLTLFWLDEQRGLWQPIPSTLDRDRRLVRAQVDHFSAYQLGDGSSPSVAFIPSLQGFQVSAFTGSSSYAIPVELPAGPGGVKPSLTLSYSSGATDGGSGERVTNQAGWVGKGWSLDTGSIARNKVRVSDSTTVEHFTMVLGGQSFHLTRGPALVSNPSDARPSDWVWHPTDESFIRMRAVRIADSTPATRGGLDHNGVPIWRYRWLVWTKDGTRHEFSEDLWWGFCVPNTIPYMETYRWLLSSSTDPHGNVISYQYGRDSLYSPAASDCGAVSGTLDRDAWPTEVRWGANSTTGSPDRYRARFVSSARSNDTAFEDAPYQFRGNQGAPRQTRQLDALVVESMPGGAWERVRQYNFGYDYSLWSDASVCTTQCGSGGDVYGPDTAYPKLTLRSVQRVGSDGTSALPPTSFSYGVRGTAKRPLGGFNRLTGINNGQGGTAAIAYAHIAAAVDNNLFWNYHRVTGRTLNDGQGNSYAWSYSYGTPALNTLGTQLGGKGPPSTPNSATLYYNRFRRPLYGDSNQVWLVDKPHSEFRGHSYVAEIDPSGAQTEHWFFQGDYRPSTADLACVPTSTGAAILSDPCFAQLRDREILRGKEWLTRRRASAGGTLLNETRRDYTVELLTVFPPDNDVGNELAGLWRAFSYESKVVQSQVEGTGTPVVSTTRYAYQPSYQGGAQYGNLTHIYEYLGDGSGSPYRTTLRNYSARVSEGGDYVVGRQIGETLTGPQGELLGVIHTFYDNSLVYGTIGPRGLPTLTRAYQNVPEQGCCAGITLQGADTRMGYDDYGNLTSTTTYAGPGTYNADTSTWSTYGNGSAARTTAMLYDSVFHALPVAVTNPLNQTEIYDYDERRGLLTSVSDANDSPTNDTTTQATYDVFGRLATLVKPGDSTAYPTLQMSYHDTARPFRYSLIARESPGASGGTRPLSQFYDGLGRLIQTKAESANGQQNIVVDTRYDGLWRTTHVSQPRYVDEIPASQPGSQFWYYTPTPGSGVRWSSTTYDALNRPLRATAPDGSWSEHHYGIVGGQTYDDVTDPNRHRTQHRYDALGRLAAVVEIRGDCGLWAYQCGGTTNEPWAVDSTTSYGYNARDQLTRVVDTLGNLTEIAYDSLGRKVGMNDPDMGRRAAPDYGWVYSYDTSGNLITQRDNKGQTLWFRYDALDRLVEKRQTNGGGTLLASYTYDQGNNGIGRRTAMSVPGVASTSWRYDARGRELQATHTVAALSVARTFGWRYDSGDRITQLIYPSGETLSYTYDAAWRPATAQSSVSGALVQSAAYSALAQPESRLLGHGLTDQWSYNDAQARLTRLKFGGQSDRSYAYDSGGNIRSITDNTGALPLQQFGYDHRDRLVDWTSGSTFQQYTFDKLGNLTSKPGQGVYHYPAAGSARPHTPTSVGGQRYDYDENGNLLSGAGRGYTWNWENMPSAISANGVSETYAYDADGARVSRTRAGSTTVYLEGLWEERSGTGSGRYLFPFDGQVIAYRDGSASSVVYLHADHLGSTTAATSTNASGAAYRLSSQEFDPWGQVRSGGVSQTSVNYTGQRLDDTGLLYYHARYYDPALARFVSPDSIVPGSAGGGNEGSALTPLTADFHEVGFVQALGSENRADAQERARLHWGGPANPQTLNRYAYVLGNPMRWTDPSGHKVRSGILNREQLGYVAEDIDYAGNGGNAEAVGSVAGAASTIGGMLMGVFNGLNAGSHADALYTIQLALRNKKGAQYIFDSADGIYIYDAQGNYLETIPWQGSAISFASIIALNTAGKYVQLFGATDRAVAPDIKNPQERIGWQCGQRRNCGGMTDQEHIVKPGDVYCSRKCYVVPKDHKVPAFARFK